MNRFRPTIPLFLIALAVAVLPASGQSEKPPVKPCTAPEYQQFDFWIGDWDVFRQPFDKSRPPAHNRITRIQGGCVILEEYDTPGGYTGISISYYNQGDGSWSQTWMDNQGAPIIHSGGLENGSMVLTTDPSGNPLDRTTWTPLENGTVRQHWQRSTDAGKSWSTVFDGIYKRRK